MKLAIIGVTGMVGKVMLEVLSEGSVEYFSTDSCGLSKFCWKIDSV